MYSISDIKHIIEAEWLNEKPFQPDASIEHLVIDSRRIAFPSASLFFALSGARQDGHDFLEAAYGAGVRHFVVSKNIDYQQFIGANFLKVPSVLRGLQDLATHHRAQFPDLKVIGITGSNGKTIVKEWLFQLLREEFNIVRSPKSFNSQVGVPLSIWQIKPEHTLAIFEAGVSQKGEMAALARMIRPTFGIFTMLGAAHAEGFASDEEKLIEKSALFREAMHVICPEEYAPKIAPILRFGAVHGWSKNAENRLQLVDYKEDKPNYSPFPELKIPFKEATAAHNASTCAAAMLTIGFPEKIINQRLKTLEPVAMRLELKAGINGCLIINDAYNFDINGLVTALDFMAQQSRGLAKTVVLSDVFQTGENADFLYKKIAALLVEKSVTRLIGIGSEIVKIQDFLSENIDSQYFNSTSSFLQQLKNEQFKESIILLKGARVFAFENIATRLELKAHKTVLEVNLNALVHNLYVFSRALKPDVKMMAMVKASAYGQGSDEVARLLEFHNVDYLAVAYTDEGIELRQKGVRLPIMVMNPNEASFDALYRYNLEPELYNLRILKNYADFIEKKTADTEGVELGFIHLKFDTGMHRLGFESADIQDVIAILTTSKNIKIASVFTHLAASEAAEHDGFTANQVAIFQKNYDQIATAIGYRPMRHVLNSSGIVRHAAYQFEMVRLGIGLYGVESGGDFPTQLQTVQSLKATISQIRIVPAIETVGYGRRGQLHRESRIATISIGYADGLLRGASNGRFSVGLRGKLAPIVGSVCMDMTMIDVTDIQEAEEGDTVEIFGENIPVQNLATALGTIPYEVFTNISERVQRVYFQV